MLSTFLYKGVPTQLPEKVAEACVRLSEDVYLNWVNFNVTETEAEAFAANSSEPSKLFLDSFLILPLSLKQLV